MRRRQSSKGQIIILVLLVLIGLVVIFGVLSTLSTRTRGAPTVQDAFWSVDGQRVTTSTVGRKVEAHIIVKAAEEYEGSITVKIRKDVARLPDSDYQMQTVPVNLKGGDEEEIELTFTPDQASNSGLFGLRGYFIEVNFQATRTTWVMENTYPPRLSATSS